MTKRSAKAPQEPKDTEPLTPARLACKELGIPAPRGVSAATQRLFEKRGQQRLPLDSNGGRR